MKITVTLGEAKSDMMFDNITIVTNERTFTFANAVIGNCMAEVTRYYEASDIIEIKFWRYKL